MTASWTFDYRACTIEPLAHQKVGIEAIVRNPFFFLTDEMGAMKTAQAICAGLFLHVAQQITRVIVVCPSAVRSVWYDPVLGELKKHLWPEVSVEVVEYHRQIRRWSSGPPAMGPKPPLRFIITNYEFVRSEDRLPDLLKACTPQTLLILDESTSVKNAASKQFKACLAMRKKCGRVLLMTGTPIANNPLDLFAQGNLLSPSILECPYITYFKAYYAIEEPVIMRSGKAILNNRGRQVKKITGWQRQDELQQRFAPYVLRRLKSECLDLPPKLDPVTLVAALTPRTWAPYKSMRDDMVVALSSGDYSIAQQAITKLIRLAQITSGFIGGIEDLGFDDDEQRISVPLQEIGREKLDVLLEWLDLRLEENPSFKVLIGARFRFEVTRTIAALKERYPDMDLGEICGGQTRESRQRGVTLLDPRTAPKGPVAVVMTNAGSMGLNLTAASTFIRLSRDFSLYQSMQADDRIHRPGQTQAVSYYDIMAEGPKGQSTIDKVILQAIREKREIADMTAGAWVTALSKE
jgi:hypothetical protein